MSGAYTFLPWAGQGLGEPDHGDRSHSARRRRIELAVSCSQLDGGSTPRSRLPPREVQLYGPGDIVGIDPRAVIRTEPLNWITNFEPNYLRGDRVLRRGFPWRYTPARARCGQPAAASLDRPHRPEAEENSSEGGEYRRAPTARSSR